MSGLSSRSVADFHNEAGVGQSYQQKAPALSEADKKQIQRGEDRIGRATERRLNRHGDHTSKRPGEAVRYSDHVNSAVNSATTKEKLEAGRPYHKIAFTGLKRLIKRG